MTSIKKTINPKIIGRYLEYNETFNSNYSFTNIILKRDNIDTLLKQLNLELSGTYPITFIKQDYLFDDIESNDSLNYHITLLYNRDSQTQKKSSPFAVTLQKTLQIDTDYKDFNRALIFRPSNTPHKYFLAISLKDCEELREHCDSDDLHISIAHFYSSSTLNELNASLKAINYSELIGAILREIDHDIFDYLRRSNMCLNVFEY